MRLVTDMVEYCAREMPLWHPISISGYHIREAGSTAAQELAFTLADGFTYVEWARRARPRRRRVRAAAVVLLQRPHRLLRGDREVPRGPADLGARAARALRGEGPALLLMRFHTQTAGVSLTAQQPEVNIVRTAIEALAAVLGGTQSLHTNSFDEALALPTEDAVRIALRTQQVIAHETGVVNTADPLGGSYYLEHLTNELERQAYDYFARIDELGGVVEAIKQNFFQGEIAEASFPLPAGGRARRAPHRRRQLASRSTRRPARRSFAIEPEIEARQIESLRALRARRDTAAVEAALAPLKEDAAVEGRNLMTPIIAAAKADVTMGEMCDASARSGGSGGRVPVF